MADDYRKQTPLENREEKTTAPNKGIPSPTPGRSLPAASNPVAATENFARFNIHFHPMTTTRFFGVIDATLKRPAEVVHALIHSPSPRVMSMLLVTLTVCLAGVGAMMGAFSGGMQYWMVPLKVTVGTVVSALICLPSLYILICLSGGAQSFGQVVRLLLLGLALSGILFLGFIPVAWIFSQATTSVIFMGVLYALIWGTGLFFGLRLLKMSFQFLNCRSMGVIGFWVVVFVLVLLQMSTTLRPLLGPYAPMQPDEKQFFITHWISQGN